MGFFPVHTVSARAVGVQETVQWHRLAPLPDETGLAGAFSGISDDVLIVAGGTNFPIPLWKDGKKNTHAKKLWHDNVYTLDLPDGRWQSAGILPNPLAYGASVSTEKYGLVCIGGCDALQYSTEVFAIKAGNGKIRRISLPALPLPCAFGCAGKLGHTIYVAAGQQSPHAKTAMKNFWAFDLSADQPAWRQLPPWPGPPRILPVAAAQDGAFFLISGCELVRDTQGQISRRYLTDAWRYNPGRNSRPGTWKQIADVPVPVAAAPTPAADFSPSHLVVFGGDSGLDYPRVFELADKHPGFSRDMLAYHTITDTWRKIGSVPAANVVTNLVHWDGWFIVPSGESRPGVRSSEVLVAKAQPVKAGFGLSNYLTITLYLAVLVAMGFYFSRREKTTDDFFLAGRRIPWWAAGLSIFGTQLSAITFMAIPALTYSTDWVLFLANMTISAIAPLLVFFYLPFYRRLNVASVYEYLELRFDLAARLVGSIAFICFQLGRMGIVIFLPALALSTVTGVNIYVCIIVMGLLATLYTALGGIEAVIWTDVLQVVVLLGGAILSLVLIVTAVPGGFGGVISTAAAGGKFHMINLTWDVTTNAVWIVVIGNIFINLVPYTSDQTVVQRYLTTSTEKQAANAIWTNAVMCIPASLLFFFLGTALWAFYKADPSLLNPTGRTDDIFPWFIARQLPAGVAGLVISGLFAAAMSSLDSSLNSMATAITTDFYRRLKPGVSDRNCLTLAKLLTLVLGLIAIGSACLMAIAASKNISMFKHYLMIVGLLGGGLAGLFIAGIFTRRTRATGILVGFFTSAGVLFLIKTKTHVSGLLYAAIAIATCVLVGWLLSFTTLDKQKKSLKGLTIYTLNDKPDQHELHQVTQL